MAAVIQVSGELARVKDGVWETHSSRWAHLLNTIEKGNSVHRIQGSDPNPDHTSARLMVGKIGGRVISFDSLPGNKTRLGSTG
jgi:hypothetical protein